MSAAVKIRPSSRLIKLRDLKREAEHIEHYRTHIQVDLERSTTALPEWERGTVAVSLSGPWKNREMDKVLAAWGVPAELRDLEALALLHGGGWALFTLPPMPDVYAYMAKAAKHREAIMYLVTLARLAIFSTLTLSESAAIVLDCVQVDPLGDSAPRASANEWARVGVSIVNAWQARQGSATVGDATRLAGLMNELKAILAERQIAQLELELAERRAALRGVA